jgi:hypothetical protein
VSVFRNTTVPDDETLLKAAREALTQPPDSWFGDPELFVTWGLTIGYTRDSDLVDVSNFERVTEDMTRTFPADTGTTTASHWAAGWTEQLRVRVIEPWADPDNFTVRDVTRAFAVITAVATALRDNYPLYDESDYSEREYEQEMKNREQNWEDVAHRLWLDYDVDEPAEADRASFDEFWRDAWLDSNSPWVDEFEAAEKIMVRRWAGFTEQDARGY